MKLVIIMDKIDVKILDCLRKNARENASVIGEKINMSVSAVIERIRKLENSGIIKGYTIVLDQERVGKDVTATIYVGLEHPKYNEGFINFVHRNNYIVECHYITGDFDFLLKVIADSTTSFGRILSDIKSIPGISLTKTNIVLSTVKNDSTVIVDTLLK